MNSDAELDAALGRQAGIALDQALLHFDRAAHGIDHAAEFDEAAVAGALDDAPIMRGDGGVDQIAAQPPEPRQRAVLVGAGEPAVADHVGDQNRRDFPGFAHGEPPSISRLAQRPGQIRLSLAGGLLKEGELQANGQMRLRVESGVVRRSAPGTSHLRYLSFAARTCLLKASDKKPLLTSPKPRKCSGTRGPLFRITRTAQILLRKFGGTS